MFGGVRSRICRVANKGLPAVLPDIAHVSKERDNISWPALVLPRLFLPAERHNDERKQEKDAESCRSGRDADRCDAGVDGLHNDRPWDTSLNLD